MRLGLDRNLGLVLQLANLFHSDYSALHLITSSIPLNSQSQITDIAVPSFVTGVDVLTPGLRASHAYLRSSIISWDSPTITRWPNIYVNIG